VQLQITATKSVGVSLKVMRIMKWVGGILAALLIAVIIFFAAFDWNSVRGYIGEKVTAQTGRQFSIAGDLDVDLSLTPKIHAEQVRFENANWGSEPNMLDLEVVDFRVRLLPLLRGEIVIPEIAFSRPTIVLEKNSEGEANWQLRKDDKEAELPHIGRLAVDAGRITYRDPATATDITVQLVTDSAKSTEETRFSAAGKFKGLPASAWGTAGPVFLLRDQTQPFPLDGKVTIGATTATVKGNVTGLAKFSAVDINLDLAGKSLADLFPIIGVTLPPTPPYQVRGHLTRQGTLWRFENFAGRVGDSDLGGDLSLETGGAKPQMTADVSSKLLDFDDLAGFVGAPAKTGPGETASPEQKKKAAIEKAKPGVLPDEEFNTARLNATNADVKYRAQIIRRSEALPLDAFVAHLVLKDGVVALKPLNFGVAGGNIVSDVAMHASQNPISVSANVRFQKLNLNQLFPKIETSKTSVGVIGGRATLSASGNSVAQWANTMDGDMALAMSGGQVSNLLLEIIGLDGAEIMKFLFGGDKNVPLRCAVADFDVEDGVLKTKTFVVDTVDTNVFGEGQVNIGKEKLDLKMRPYPKDASILSLRSPIRIEGEFEDPEIRPDKKLYARAGAALALGALVNPLTALIPLIETGPGEDSNCAALIAEARGVKGQGLAEADASNEGAAGKPGK
jgi:uncharacterized protein involved in outer membrane biogenesis